MLHLEEKIPQIAARLIVICLGEIQDGSGMDGTGTLDIFGSFGRHKSLARTMPGPFFNICSPWRLSLTISA